MDSAVTNGNHMKRYLVTGGTGFIGRSLVRALVERGDKVRILDDDSRGNRKLLSDLDVEVMIGDIRSPQSVLDATRGIDHVCHLAYINGTGTFYEKPTLILDIALRGILNVVDACIKNDVPELSLASTPEAYQMAPIVPTDETVALTVPDPHNPRYSYGGGKIISELMVLNYGQKFFQKAIVFRPHSIYGPQMGFAHVIPQLTDRVIKAIQENKNAYEVDLPIQGSGMETRSFCYISDCVDGILTSIDKGDHLGIYHVGTEEEVSINELARQIGVVFDRVVHPVPGELQKGSPTRRCPNISKLRGLGYEPKVKLQDGLLNYIGSLDVLDKVSNVQIP